MRVRKAVVVVVAFVFGVVVGNLSPAISADDSCSETYEKAAIAAYNRLEQCILSTNNESWGERLFERSICNAEYIVDSLAAASALSACVSIGRLLPKVQ